MNHHHAALLEPSPRPLAARRLLALAAALAATACPAAAADGAALYANDFQQVKPGALPDGEFVVLDGAFEVKAEGTETFIELPGAPLDTFGALFGPTQADGLAVAARMHGTKQGRRFPTFALGLNGAGGYRLQVSPAKGQIELFKGDEPKASAAFAWESGTWTQVRLQVRKVKDGAWRVEGKAWVQGKPEPADWMIGWDENTAPSAGRASIWGAPYAGTPVRFDDLRVTAAGR